MSIKNSLWNERYRCSNIDEFIGTKELIDDIKQYIKNNDIPHLLLTGKPGTGKTTLAKLITYNIACDNLILNASDENGIDTIREKVKNFAQSSSFNPLKIIILDEADYLTKDAQAALRNIIEIFSKTTRFILTCNYIEKISEPIQSRCTLYRMEPPSKGEVAKRLVTILENEQVKYELEDIAKIVNGTYPDVRKAINISQKSSLNGSLVITKDINQDYIEEIITLIDQNNKDTWRNIRQVIVNNNLRDFQDIYRALYEKYFAFPEIVFTLGEGLYKQSFVPDKEIAFMAMIKEILEKLKKKLING